MILCNRRAQLFCLAFTARSSEMAASDSTEISPLSLGAGRSCSGAQTVSRRQAGKDNLLSKKDFKERLRDYGRKIVSPQGLISDDHVIQLEREGIAKGQVWSTRCGERAMLRNELSRGPHHPDPKVNRAGGVPALFSGEFRRLVFGSSVITLRCLLRLLTPLHAAL
ncbi:hypothetical protein AOLI_G00282870 [Acnodon oligacanthus]